MKKVLMITLMMCLCITSFGQTTTYSKVIQTDSIGKDVIYSKVKEWIADTYVSSKSVIEMEDRESGLIIGNGNFNYNYPDVSVFRNAAYGCYSGIVKYTIKIQIKDNRFRVEITNFIHSVNPGNCKCCIVTNPSTGIQKTYNDKAWLDMKIKCENYSNNIFTSLENTSKSWTKTNIKNDW